ncbi:IS200/IS605 family accessory protein TnpB-related protein [Rhodococcus sp. ARC_M6]|uniref:IS200/IS605 family accessory protein TnpB-related protein n=1 Tax=Rhodococcus sp. ARC_M6 TaxID=2928852 RepID=UPI001FB4A74C|nr:IS200/IS605 family accessory protein TnpB-related protein [Rhodococcus sp. ARC_M6]MCJ0907488.1 IS200/IS605 family accessory protein TnpB-related protein [Rhodococcus sp. ARC_M6]
MRTALQKVGTKSAKRKLKTRRRKEQRFATDINHQLSKNIVAGAQRTDRGIAIEDLSGIRDRVRLAKKQRAQVHSWAYAQLRNFVDCKAEAVGVPVQVVNPRNTSRTCSQCGFCDARNRRSQSVFVCGECGWGGPGMRITMLPAILPRSGMKSFGPPGQPAYGSHRPGIQLASGFHGNTR